jgi:hypothetical protein
MTRSSHSDHGEFVDQRICFTFRIILADIFHSARLIRLSLESPRGSDVEVARKCPIQDRETLRD